MSSNKIRDALLEASIALSWATHNHLTSGDAEKYLKIVDDALSAPQRNCDVGTPEDQHNRFMRFCDSKSMGYCWGRGCRKCIAQWGQMPYEEGGAK